MAAVTKLKFRIVFCTSEEQEFPASELLRHGPNSKGWSSARFCDYPQELLLQFPTVVRIKQLQFLSHQCKISSKIELYTYTPERMTSLPSIPSIHDMPFKRLGYMSLDSNEKSGFQARELKSVYLDSMCLFLKITLNKCHTNTANLFNQVGLIAINVLGEELGSQDEPSPLQGRAPRSKYDSNFEQDLEFDQATVERLRALNSAKQKAIENEDFEEAKHLKDAIERLKSVGVNLLQLEERKRIAVQNEDFESAKIIKMEIDRLRNAVAPPMPGVGAPNIFAPVQASSHRPFSGGPQPLGVGSRPISRRQPGQKDPYGDPYEPRGGDIFAPKNAQIFDEPTKAVPHDEQVIPTMAHGKGPGQALADEGGDPGEYDPRNPDEFTAQTAKLADPLIGVLGEDIARRLFSRTWQMREEALMKIKVQLEAGSGSELFGGVDKSQVMTAVLGSIRHTVLDKVSQVSMRSMEVIQTLFDWVGPMRTQARGEAQEHVHNILTGLLEKIGDNAVKVRGLTEVAFMTMCRSEIVGCGPAVQLILKPGGAKASSIKHTIGRLALLDKIVSEFKIDNSSVPFQPVVEYALNGYQNSSGEVRTASINLLKTIYDCVGSRLQQHLTKLRPAQLETLNNIFAGGEGPRDEEEPVQNRAPSRKQSNPPARTPPPIAPQTPTCPFCGKTDPSFANSDFLDVHYWKECAMLTACALCNLVVEIPKLNEHLLRECQDKDQAGECPRCKEAVPVEELDDHIEQQSCYPSKPLGVANRCPLCHEDIPPGVDGWKQHILTDGCPNNERSSY